MGLRSDLEPDLKKIFGDAWSIRDGQVVPDDSSVGLGNNGVKLEAVVLYADMVASTTMVDGRTPEFAAEVYKAYLLCAGKAIRAEGGVITAYDGDRIMAVFIGNTPNSDATRAALKIKGAVEQVAQPLLKAQYPNTTHVMKGRCGIDRSNLLVAKAGVRGANDLVWVGRAANHAAKMAALDGDYSTYISGEVYDRLVDNAKYVNGDKNGTNMWTELVWKPMNNRRIFGSTYYWSL